MPRIPTLPVHETNGHAVRAELADYLREHLCGDAVEIGSPKYAPGDGDETASWEDVARLVAGIRWLIPQWVPYGMLTGIIAEPKVGMSGFALGALARPIITGCDWFSGLPGPEPGYVVWCDTEGSAAINIQRAAKWGLPMDRIKVPFPDDPLRPIDLDDSTHLDRIFNVVCRYRAKLLQVDSFRGAHGGNENDSKIARVLQSLANIGEQTRAAVNLIHHTKKLFDGEELTANSGRGSNAFLAMVRCQIAIDRPDPEGEWRRARVLGENLGTAPPPIGFRFTESGLDFGPPPQRPRKQTEKDDAENWLRARMKPGQTYKASEILLEAEQHGHTRRTTQRAATDGLGIKPRPVRQGGRIIEWEWNLPVPGEGISEAIPDAGIFGGA